MDSPSRFQFTNWADEPPTAGRAVIMPRSGRGWSCDGATHRRQTASRDWRKNGNSGANLPLMRWTMAKGLRFSHLVFTLICMLCLAIRPADAAFINFENCLDPNIVNSSPLQLQFIPLYFWAAFNTSAVSRNLNVTVYGNVSGIATLEPLPGPNDPQWRNPNDTTGKIIDLSPENNKYTTLFANFKVLSYTSYEASPQRFCNTSIHGTCPLVPAFFANGSNPAQLPAFSISHDFYSSYAFTTVSATLRVTSGDLNNAALACISASITPDIGDTLQTLLRYIPLIVLILVGVATIFAAIWSPWGSTDLFRWTSNLGRDEDLLRLVTPGFGDCLQYIQFIVLTGGLSLNYPGYYQPVVSQVGWSALMFNESFVSNGNGSQSLVDGIYAVNGTYGMDRLSQLVGMTAVKDIWAGMIIWLLVIVLAIIVLVQLGFAFRWLHRQMKNVQEEDLRARNFPFTAGNVIRIVFNYFLLPLVALTMFQLVVAGRSPASVVGVAVIVLIAVLAVTGWFLYLIGSTRPRSFLFDDTPTLLLYGPLYNTFSDEAATFALVPLFLNIVRGIAIGAIQPSGIAQLVILAICEIILALTLNAFRPFPSSTSMNAYHTFFAIVRLLTILLSVAFVPSLGVAEAPRGWIGYVILLMHAIVLVFGFFLNAVQTLVEVGARLAGAGGDGRRGPLGKTFGMRQLSRRAAQQDPGTRHSMTSDAAMLGNEAEQKSLQLENGHVRSLSGSSAQLLNRTGTSEGRASVILESSSSHGLGHNRGSSGPYTPSTPGAGSTFSYGPTSSQHAGGTVSPGGAILGIKQAENPDPYYRPPRARRATIDLSSPTARSTDSWNTGQRSSQLDQDLGEGENPLEGPSVSEREVPTAAHLGATKDDLDFASNEVRRTKTDYAVREVDFYYGVRGPALSSMPTRRLKTGPADPNGPVSSATGWFKGFFGGKSKDKGKGFEVVRSTRALPPGMLSELDTAQGSKEPYRDDPDTWNAEEAIMDGSEDDYDSRAAGGRGISQLPPSLPQIDTGGGIELPSRVGSRTSKGSVRHTPPSVPRKSSKRRQSSAGSDLPRLSAIAGSPPASPQAPRRPYNPDGTSQRHLQPSAPVHGRLPFGTDSWPSKSGRRSMGGESAASSLVELGDYDGTQHANLSHSRHSSSALGGLAPDLRDDRPASVGYVQHHRASDNIHESSPDSPQLLGSSAEFVGDHSQRSFGGP